MRPVDSAHFWTNVCVWQRRHVLGWVRPGSSQGDINVGASGHVNRRVGRPSATRCSLLELGLAFSGHEPAF
ncbi:hypothetical protein BD309DRAFT_861554 [Dichomitus squalens]|nr:hypothetical protein BD309DRAFT_861554 [Dichomitus squalens]